jgi:hypothetical protein
LLLVRQKAFKERVPIKRAYKSQVKNPEQGKGFQEEHYGRISLQICEKLCKNPFAPMFKG